MRYLIVGIILVVLSCFLIFSPIDKLYSIWPNIPTPIAPRIGGGIGLVLGIFILFLQFGEWFHIF